jgi:hypothetical protein
MPRRLAAALNLRTPPVAILWSAHRPEVHTRPLGRRDGERGPRRASGIASVPGSFLAQDTWRGLEV